MSTSNLLATGIVAEYNPFHNGHLYHIKETKKIIQQPIIAVMSASLMQRGEFTYFNKWLRAQLAVENGVDLVLELPTAFSLRSAEFFASGAVNILKACGCVNHLCCGVENPNYDFFKLAKTIKNVHWQNLLQQKLKTGTSYATACAELLPDINLHTPNDILALEYCKVLLDSNIRPIFIHRLNADYNDLTIQGDIASATAIRKNLNENKKDWLQSVPENTINLLKTYKAGYDTELLWKLINYRLRLLTPQQIAQRCQCSEGLENLLKKSANATSLNEAIRICTNKRYSSSRIRRLFLQLLLDQPKNFIEQKHPAYLRVLAFNDTGRLLLKEMKKIASLPIITKLGKLPYKNQTSAFSEQIQLELITTDLWSMLQYNETLNRSGNDFLLSPIYVKE